MASAERFRYGFRVFETDKGWRADIMQCQVSPRVGAPQYLECSAGKAFSLSGDAVAWAEARCAELQESEINTAERINRRLQAKVNWPDLGVRGTPEHPDFPPKQP